MSANHTALITGASMGIGEEIARSLASRTNHLILVARSEDKLKKLAERLGSEFGVQTTVIAMDLAAEGAAAKLYEQVADQPIDILVNNAGFGFKGAFLDLDLAGQQAMMHLNMVTLTEMCHLFGKAMVERGHGRILNVASVAAFQPGPKMAVYCASKAYVLSLSEALDAELRGQGVTVTALCPGAVDTNFHVVAKNETNKLLMSTAMAPRPVAEAGVRALFAGRRMVVPGLLNCVSVMTSRMMPRKASTRVTQKLIEG
ncbi:SDR family oxidoreductase [Marinobacteraceae bacterium S3BR75-40.1]